MRYDISIIKLQVKKQKVFCILPLLFIYLCLLPYQVQLLKSGKSMDEILREIFTLNQKYFVLFALWYLFLCFRMMLCDEMKELTRCLDSRLRFRWVLYGDILYLMVLLPYLLCMIHQVRAYKEIAWITILQILCFSFGMYFFLQATENSFISLCAMLIWYFVCLNHWIPDAVSGLRTNELADMIEGRWFILQIAGALICVCLGETAGILGKLRN